MQVLTGVGAHRHPPSSGHLHIAGITLLSYRGLKEHLESRDSHRWQNHRHQCDRLECFCTPYYIRLDGEPSIPRTAPEHFQNDLRTRVSSTQFAREHRWRREQSFSRTVGLHSTRLQASVLGQASDLQLSCRGPDSQRKGVGNVDRLERSMSRPTFYVLVCRDRSGNVRIGCLTAIMSDEPGRGALEAYEQSEFISLTAHMILILAGSTQERDG